MNFFDTQEYREIFIRHFCRREDVVEGIWEKHDGGLVLVGMKPVLGQEEVTDYAKDDIENLPSGKVRLDYVREQSQTYKKFGPGERQEVSPYIDLPASWEDYLAGLERKNRKELKRKFNRLEPSQFEVVTENNLTEFFRLHRLSDPNKNKFMSEAMATFFTDVFKTPVPGWQARLDFINFAGKTVAATMSLVSQSEWWLYNSGYDPQFSHYSVGLLLKATNIRQAIELKKKKFDFLRGSERYKYELGAKDANLYRIEITTT